MNYVILPYMKPVLVQPIKGKPSILQNTNRRAYDIYYKNTISGYTELLTNLRVWFMLPYREKIVITKPTYFLNTNKENIAVPIMIDNCCNLSHDDGSDDGNDDENDDENEKPIINILGGNPVCIPKNETYFDSGAIATDKEDGDITESMSTINTVDVSKEGYYTVEYNVTDSDGATADTKKRDVYVYANTFGDFTFPVQLECKRHEVKDSNDLVRFDDYSFPIVFGCNKGEQLEAEEFGNYIFPFHLGDDTFACRSRECQKKICENIKRKYNLKCDKIGEDSFAIVLC